MLNFIDGRESGGFHGATCYLLKLGWGEKVRSLLLLHSKNKVAK